MMGDFAAHNDPSPLANTLLHAALGRYQLEVLRWNRQINLVSRQGTQALVAELIGQCRSAWVRLEASVLADWPHGGPVWYFDLGSGGGLPGFVWHLQLACRCPVSRTWLVEPRAKRAWFLERLNQLVPAHPLRVWAAPWGQTPSVEGPTAPGHILISLKALHLNDVAVLDGLAAALAGPLAGVSSEWGAVLVIARFYPPDQRLNRRLVADLGISAVPVVCGDLTCQPTGHRVLAPSRQETSGAALVVSTYRVSR
jgi:hypothetical protein